jgi:hypothetical protein
VSTERAYGTWIFSIQLFERYGISALPALAVCVALSTLGVYAAARTIRKDALVT